MAQTLNRQQPLININTNMGVVPMKKNEEQAFQYPVSPHLQRSSFKKDTNVSMNSNRSFNMGDMQKIHSLDRSMQAQQYQPAPMPAQFQPS